MTEPPEWARWQADNSPRAKDAESNRRFWHFMAWEVRFWLALIGLVVAICVVFVIWLVVQAL